jgi:hypothetical protein
MLLELLEDAGYKVNLTAKSRYMKGLVPLLGGQFTLNILKHPDILRLFSNAQIRKGQAYSLKQLAQIANPQHEMERFIGQMKTLSASNTFIRGYRLQCPTCDLDTWYALDDVAEMVICEGCRTIALTVGNEESKEALKTCLAMGCTEAVLVEDEAFEGSDTLGTARILAAAIEKVGDVQVALFAKQAIDGDTGQTAVQTARKLGWTPLTFVSAIKELDPAAGTITVERLV